MTYSRAISGKRCSARLDTDHTKRQKESYEHTIIYDPLTYQTHIYSHSVSESEVEDI